VASGSVEEKIRALYLAACDPNASEEEARSKALALCRIAAKHGLALFYEAPSGASTALTHEDLTHAVLEERASSQRAILQLRQAHEREIRQTAHEAYARGQREALPPRPRVAALHEPPDRAPLTLGSWNDVARYLATHPHGTQLELPRTLLPHPAFEGATRSLGMPRGQDRDWRFPPDAYGRGLHVHDFRRYWRAHLDAVHLFGHLRRDVF
jgi:hypothetical protein